MTFDMQIKNRQSLTLAVLCACTLLSSGSALAQNSDKEARKAAEAAAEQKSKSQETKQAQAVSKEVYDKIAKAQELSKTLCATIPKCAK